MFKIYKCPDFRRSLLTRGYDDEHLLLYVFGKKLDLAIIQLRENIFFIELRRSHSPLDISDSDTTEIMEGDDIFAIGFQELQQSFLSVN